MSGGVAYGEMRWKRSRLLGVVACLSLITLLNVSFSWWSNRPSPFSDSSSLDTLAAATRRLRISLSIAALANVSSDPRVKDNRSVVEAFSNSTAVLRRERRKENRHDPAEEDSVYALRYGEPPRRGGTPKNDVAPSSQESTTQTEEPSTESARDNAWGKRGEPSTFTRDPTEDNWTDATMDHKRLANSLENDTSNPQNSRPEWTKQANRTCEWSMKRNTSNSNHLRQSNRLTSREAVTASSSCHQGYLISLDYDQQIMASFKAFYHLAVFASLFNLSIVEPYFHGKGRLGVPLVNTGAPSLLKLTDFYDHHQLESALRSCADMDLVSFEKFAENASPVVTFVSFLPSIEGYESYFSGEEKIVEIHNNLQTIDDGLKKLNSWTSFTRRHLEQKEQNFTWSRIILIDARPLYPISLLQIQQKLGSILHRQVEQFGTATVVLDNWRDIGGHSSYFYWIQGFNRRICKEMLTTSHSNTVINAARNFATMLNLTRPVIGVHIRGEKLIIYSKNSHSHYKHCLQQLRDFLEGVAKTSKGSVVLFHDLGKYGSNSCHHYNVCRTERPNFISEIEEFEYRVASYDPSWFRPALLQGVFAAFVEKELLSSVDILVTVGLGSYQQSIVDRFLDRTGTSVSNNLHRLCFSKHS